MIDTELLLLHTQYESEHRCISITKFVIRNCTNDLSMILFDHEPLHMIIEAICSVNVFYPILLIQQGKCVLQSSPVMKLHAPLKISKQPTQYKKLGKIFTSPKCKQHLTLRSFQVFTCPLLQTKLHLLITVLLSTFKAPLESWNPLSKAAPGKVHRSGGHDMAEWRQH